MPTDKRVDAFIAKSADFAKPILTTLRSIVHEGCPEATETIKWGMPFFEYNGPLCFMSAFKAHCGFGFWKAGNILDDKIRSDEAMGHLGRITSVKDLPPKKVLIQYVKAAKSLKDSPAPSQPKSARKAPDTKSLAVPSYLTAALRKNKKASTNFDAFSYSKKKEYVEWLTEAKTDETRDKRLKTTIEWLAEGKSRNWKYERC